MDLKLPTNRTARVKLDGKHYSKQITMKEDVPQGNVISSTLFFIYINDITKGITLYLHADDLPIWSSTDYATTAKVRVHEAINTVFKRTQDWGLAINPNKTVATKFSLKTEEQGITLTMNGKVLLTEEAPSFLGVTLVKPGTHISTKPTRKLYAGLLL
ncbi:tick transposon [Elysia marginata]|uniref:Tick transposon n=1 Tax=Elysia marginata TaxID=1093978 RepID=A0AAV4EU25_9GAST|nr:tick transposon [Elysia marginata]